MFALVFLLTGTARLLNDYSSTVFEPVAETSYLFVDFRVVIIIEAGRLEIERWVFTLPSFNLVVWFLANELLESPIFLLFGSC